MRLLLLAAVLALTAPALAQESAPDSACTYEACALQIEGTSLGVRLVRGGVPVAAPPADSVRSRSLITRLAGIGPPPPLPLAEAVASSPEALAHVRNWRRGERTATRLFGGALTTLTVVAVLTPFDVLSDDVQSAAFVGAAGLGVLSFPVRARARRSRDRAIETYNSGLER